MSIVNHLKQHSQWPAVVEILQALQSEGYEAYLAGGCVRDALLQRPATDLDVATNATPDQIEKIFRKTISVGKSFGVMRVLIQGADIEVATFRKDGVYKDGRRPEDISFSSPEEDAKRRDFTINALFFDLEKEQVIDFVFGVEDLKNQTLRAVGDPFLRFEEDKLRILRALRFVSQLGFVIETKTFEAIKISAPQVTQVSPERLKEEFFKLLKGSFSHIALTQTQESGVLKILFPEYVKSVWQNSLSATFEGWQNFSLFLSGISMESVEILLEKYRCSNFEKKAIINAVKVFQNNFNWQNLRQGEILKLLQDEGIYFAVSLGGPAQHSSISNLGAAFARFNEWDKKLPESFLKGQDVSSEIKGKDIGRILEEFYFLQLEGVLNSREQALERLSKTKLPF